MMKSTSCLLALVIFLPACKNKNNLFGKGSVSTVAACMQAPARMMQMASASPQSKPALDESEKNGLTSDITVVQKPAEKKPAEIIRNASIEFQVKDAEASHQKITELVKQNGAYFSADNKLTDGGRINVDFEIRVPSANLDKLMNELMEESVYTNYKNITAEDITAGFVDTETRLKTKKEVEQRYLDILKQANKVSDILAVESQLRMVREEIESAEGRLKLMNDQVAYSTISLKMYQTLAYSPKPAISFISRIKEAVTDGWRSFINALVVLVNIWPWMIIAFVALFAFIGRRKRSVSLPGA